MARYVMIHIIITNVLILCGSISIFINFSDQISDVV